MGTSILFVHSPLVGPSTWWPTARLLAGRGSQVAVPTLTAFADAPPPQGGVLVDLAAAAGSELAPPVAVVGHSGAGAFLPLIGDRLGPASRVLVFVDAVVPPQVGTHETPGPMAARLDELTIDGRLPRWLDWWSDDVAAQLVPDPSDRRALREEMPRLPRAFYDEPVPVPDGWSTRPCAYLQLSDAYDAEFHEAGARGWERRALDSHHLAIHGDPIAVADALEAMLADLVRSTPGPDRPTR